MHLPKLFQSFVCYHLAKSLGYLLHEGNMFAAISRLFPSTGIPKTTLISSCVNELASFSRNKKDLANIFNTSLQDSFYLAAVP